MFQDDSRRTKEIATLYSGIGELKNRLGKRYDRFARKKLTHKEQQIADLLEFSEDEDGKTVVTKKRNAISAKENACGRFAVVTTSKKQWSDLSNDSFS